MMIRCRLMDYYYCVALVNVIFTFFSLFFCVCLCGRCQSSCSGTRSRKPEEPACRTSTEPAPAHLIPHTHTHTNTHKHTQAHKHTASETNVFLAHKRISQEHDSLCVLNAVILYMFHVNKELQSLDAHFLKSAAQE